MNWEEILETEEEWEEAFLYNVDGRRTRHGPLFTPRERTPEYWAARQRRVEKLREEVAQGTYHVPVILVAQCIVEGRPKWGEALIDDEGNRRDEWWREIGSYNGRIS